MGMLGHQVLALIVAKAGRLRDGWRALLMAVPQVETVYLAEAASAVAMAKTYSPDFVLLDADALGDEAWDLLERIKASRPQCRCVVLICNARQSVEAQAFGADAVLTKGFPATKLFETVEQLLPERNLGDRGSASG